MVNVIVLESLRLVDNCGSMQKLRVCVGRLSLHFALTLISVRPLTSIGWHLSKWDLGARTMYLMAFLQCAVIRQRFIYESNNTIHALWIHMWNVWCILSLLESVVKWVLWSRITLSTTGRNHSTVGWCTSWEFCVRNVYRILARVVCAFDEFAAIVSNRWRLYLHVLTIHFYENERECDVIQNFWSFFDDGGKWFICNGEINNFSA